jgi:hypothetical protein
MTAKPIAKTVKMPFTFEAQVHAMKTPVAISHPHQAGENSLERCQMGNNRHKLTIAPVTQLAEANVRVHRQRHEENECGVKQNQAGLRNMCVVYIDSN